ncbi:MAG: glycosyltransferase family 8 protein [Bacteriovoracaceae bacterium]|nr:glycosyltransferase family 8 protein [Bacteriovoracaceae bacterium]
MAPITICFCANNDYVGVLGISIMSILESAVPGEAFDLYVLDNKISEKGKEELTALKNRYQDFSLTFLPFDEQIFRSCVPATPMRGYWMALSIFGRYLIPQLIAADKVLYLDCDIMVRKSLRELWETDLGDAYIAGVPDYNIIKAERLKERLGADFNDREYLNSGVLLMNNRLWLEEHLYDRLMAYTTEHAIELRSPDQDAINVVCHGRKKLLPERYNVRNYMYMPDLYADHPRRQEIIQESKDPVIRHFHPWKRNHFVIHRDEWIALAKKSAWPFLVPHDDPKILAWIKIFLRYWARHPFFFILPRFYRRLRARGIATLLLDH